MVKIRDALIIRSAYQKSVISVKNIVIDYRLHYEINILVAIFTAQLAGKARQLGCPKIVLDHMCVYIYVCVLWVSSPLVVYDAIDNASSSRAMRTEN